MGAGEVGPDDALSPWAGLQLARVLRAVGAPRGVLALLERGQGLRVTLLRGEGKDEGGARPCDPTGSGDPPVNDGTPVSSRRQPFRRGEHRNEFSPADALDPRERRMLAGARRYERQVLGQAKAKT